VAASSCCILKHASPSLKVASKPRQNSKMPIHPFLRLSAFAALVWLSLHFSGALYIFQDPADAPDKAKLYDPAQRFEQVANHTNEVVDTAKVVYTNFLSKTFLSTEDLTLEHDTSALIDTIRASFQTVAALDSDIDLADCKPLLHFIEVCGKWHTNPSYALPNAATVRIVLRGAGIRLNRCIAALDKVENQHAALTQLAESTMTEDYTARLFSAAVKPFAPLSTSISPQETSRQARGLRMRFDEARIRSTLAFVAIKLWMVETVSMPKIFANARRALKDSRERLG
jgi:hypothetical protein